MEGLGFCQKLLIQLGDVSELGLNFDELGEEGFCCCRTFRGKMKHGANSFLLTIVTGQFVPCDNTVIIQITKVEAI